MVLVFWLLVTPFFPQKYPHFCQRNALAELTAGLFCQCRLHDLGEQMWGSKYLDCIIALIIDL